MVTFQSFNASTNISIHALQLHVCIANSHLNSLDNIYCTFEKLYFYTLSLPLPAVSAGMAHITTHSWLSQIPGHSPLSQIVVHSVCWALIDDGPALRMSSPGTLSSPAAFPNFICFTAASTSLSSGAGSVLVNVALVTGI